MISCRRAFRRGGRPGARLGDAQYLTILETSTRRCSPAGRHSSRSQVEAGHLRIPIACSRQVVMPGRTERVAARLPAGSIGICQLAYESPLFEIEGVTELAEPDRAA